MYTVRCMYTPWDPLSDRERFRDKRVPTRCKQPMKLQDINQEGTSTAVQNAPTSATQCNMESHQSYRWPPPVLPYLSSCNRMDAVCTGIRPGVMTLDTQPPGHERTHNCNNFVTP
jgi:hypothetical protein